VQELVKQPEASSLLVPIGLPCPESLRFASLFGQCEAQR